MELVTPAQLPDRSQCGQADFDADLLRVPNIPGRISRPGPEGDIFSRHTEGYQVVEGVGGHRLRRGRRVVGICILAVDRESHRFHATQVHHRAGDRQQAPLGHNIAAGGLEDGNLRTHAVIEAADDYFIGYGLISGRVGGDGR